MTNIQINKVDILISSNNSGLVTVAFFASSGLMMTAVMPPHHVEPKLMEVGITEYSVDQLSEHYASPEMMAHFPNRKR